jgi:anoctamin-10
MVLVPRFMALYQSAAVKLTWWENHARQSTHEASLTVKTFSLSAIVAYLGLALSAFVCVRPSHGVCAGQDR